MFETNKISTLLGIKYPIFQGGMAWASSGKLACSVSNAGGLGIIGCAGREAEWVLNEIKYAKNNTSNQIGLNVALNDENAVNIIEIAVENDIKYFTMGGIHTYLKLISRFSKDVLIIPVVGSAMEAKLAERAGAKSIICEGQESGGSIGGLSLFSLLPQVVDAVKIPVIAKIETLDEKLDLKVDALDTKIDANHAVMLEKTDALDTKVTDNHIKMIETTSGLGTLIEKSAKNTILVLITAVGIVAGIALAIAGFIW